MLKSARDTIRLWCSSTYLLVLMMLVGFARTCIGPSGFDIDRSASPVALILSGGSLPFDWIEDEWWRFATSIFLHAGPVHLIFNLVALLQIGPPVGAIFGGGRMLFLFMVTGIIASVGSSLTGTLGVRIGASGAIMGLIGIAAGWGHRKGTAHGIEIRDQMLWWGFYTVVYGYVFEADNVAHILGFLVGGVVGYFSCERNQRDSTALGEWMLSVTGVALASVAIGIVIFQPACLSDMWGDIDLKLEVSPDR